MFLFNCRVASGFAVFVAWLTLAVAASPVLGTEEEQPPANQGNPAADLPAHRVVVRISAAMLDSLMDKKEVDRELPVQDVILGTTVYGRTRVVGKPSAKLSESDHEAAFEITVRGVANSQTKGYNGPAIVHSRAVTSFLATKRVVLEPGKGFQGLPPTVAARTDVFVDGIESTRGGLVGRIVRRRATSIEAAQHAQSTEIARQRAIQRIATVFNHTSEQRLARLNWMTDLRTVIATAVGNDDNQDVKFTCSTTPQYMQIATGEGDTAIELPEGKVAASHAPMAPIEIWVHESLVGKSFGAAMDLLGGDSKTEKMLLTTLATAPLLAAKPAAISAFRSVLENSNISSQAVGPWRLIEVDMPAITAQQTLLAENTPEQDEPASPTATNQREQPLREQPASTRTHYRIWTSGPFTADAEFVALEGSMVRLRRTTGVRTSIPLVKLSLADQNWIASYLASR